MFEIKIAFPADTGERLRFEHQLIKAGVPPGDVKLGRVSSDNVQLRQLIRTATIAGDFDTLEAVDFDSDQPFLGPERAVVDAIDAQARFRMLVKTGPKLPDIPTERGWTLSSTEGASDVSLQRLKASTRRTLEMFAIDQPVKLELGAYYNPGYAARVLEYIRGISAQVGSVHQDGSRLSVESTHSGGEHCQWWNPFQADALCARSVTITITRVKDNVL